MSHAEKDYSVASNPFPQTPCDPLVLFAGESRTKPGHAVGPKVLNYYLIHYILSGRGTFEYGGQAYELGAGDCFLIEPERLVSYTADAKHPWHYRWAAFQGASVPTLLNAVGFSAGRSVAYGLTDRTVAKTFNRMQTALRDRTAHAAFEATGALYVLLAACGQALIAQHGTDTAVPELPAAGIVREAIHYLTTQYAEEITIETMADSLGYNRAYLSRLFKHNTGLTPVTFLLRLRIDNARRLLRERRDLTVEQIAFSVGFRDPLYFSKQFKRMHGQSPSEYRVIAGRV
jgi:AraC-like DNA-binding protein